MLRVREGPGGEGASEAAALGTSTAKLLKKKHAQSMRRARQNLPHQKPAAVITKLQQHVAEAPALCLQVYDKG